tara:strand:- start:590 stop:1456 length:867 start_codon:yes stop_codon:yes gene_type:complete
MHHYSDSEIRNICKEKLEALEHWLRRLIDLTLTPVYGDIFIYEDEKGNRLVKTKISTSVEDRLRKEPNRYSRKIDAILLDDAIDIICKPDLFKNHFNAPFKVAFPDGRDVTRTFLKRLTDPRNRLAHANPISTRQAEQVICYTNDVIDSIKEFYRVENMQVEFNVPLIIKVIDSFGNTYFRENIAKAPSGEIVIDHSNDSKYYLRPNDILTLEVEVDPSFEESDYTIEWRGVIAEMKNLKKVALQLENRHVGQQFSLSCNITSKEDWHRIRGKVDDVLIYQIKVLPPV